MALQPLAEERISGSGVTSVGMAAGSVFTVEIGPIMLPSEHLAELRETGLTKIRLCCAAAVAEMKATMQERMDLLVAEREADGDEVSGDGRIQEFNLGNDAGNFSLVEQQPLFAKLHSNPIMLHMLETFAGGPVRAAHAPSTRITMPQDGSLGPGGGWHCDTPYNAKPFRDYQRESGAETFPDVSRPLGIQCNLCVDEYTEENGGTM